MDLSARYIGRTVNVQLPDSMGWVRGTLQDIDLETVTEQALCQPEGHRYLSGMVVTVSGQQLHLTGNELVQVAPARPQPTHVAE